MVQDPRHKLEDFGVDARAVGVGTNSAAEGHDAHHEVPGWRVHSDRTHERAARVTPTRVLADHTPGAHLLVCDWYRFPD